MSHRRVKNVDYGDDYDDIEDEYEDDYGGENEDELTEEDRLQLQQGTIKVKAALGTPPGVSDKQIQDALWNYYYDIDKSVAYLKTLRKPPAQTQKKAKAAAISNGMFIPQPSDDVLLDHKTSSLDSLASGSFRGRGLMRPSADATESRHFETVATLGAFEGISWDYIPKERRAVLTHVPRQPPGGLRGGSGKPSKLAALAAARKAKEADKAAGGTTLESRETDRSINLLDRLGSGRERVSSGSDVLERPRQMVFPSRQKKAASPERTPIASLEIVEESPAPQENLKATPSIFAKVMLGESEDNGGVSLHEAPERIDSCAGKGRIFRLPYLLDPNYAKSENFLKPSPDDVVLRAQGRHGRNATATPGKSQPISNAKSTTEALDSLKISEPLKPKSKGLNVVQELAKSKLKKAASFVVVGHIDHGKSTLMGRLLLDLGVIDAQRAEKLARESEKIGKGSFALAWVMDTSNDERTHGVTVDFATNHFETEKTRFTILDAPGHKDFVPNMIAGASQADFGVLVIDAGPNSFESGLRGQTKEHALLLRSLGVQRVIVAVNKMDMCDWSKERFSQISREMAAFLTKADFSRESISFIPCSGLKGQNITKAPGFISAKWYEGPTLVAELENAEPTQRNVEKPLRMTISDVFKETPNELVSIAGKIDAGSLQVGDVIRVMPANEDALIKSIEADGLSAEWAVAGQIVVLNLTDIDPDHLFAGNVVCSPSSPIKNVKKVTAKILSIEHIFPMYVVLHQGALRSSALINRPVAILDKTSGEVERKKPQVIQPGQVARITLDLEDELPLEAPSRIILRTEGRTVATGKLE